MQRKENVQGHLCALFTILVWGTTFVSTKVLLLSFSPFAIILVRFGVAAAALCALYPHRMPLREKRHHTLFAAAALCGVVLYFLMENIALTFTAASNVGVIVSVSPLFTGLLLRFLEPGHRLRPNFFIGFAAALLGIGLISFAGASLSLNPLGDLLAVGAAAAWAVYSILLKKIGTLGYNTLGTTRRIFLYGLVVLLPVALVADGGFPFAALANTTNLLNLLYLGVCASALCFVAWGWAVQKIGPVKAGAYIYAVPVVAVVCSTLVLGEPIGPPTVLGVLLTLVGLVVSELPVRVKKHEENRTG